MNPDNPLNFGSDIESNEWTDDYERILKNVLHNSTLMSDHHKKEHLQY